MNQPLKNIRIAIAVSLFNDFISKRLLTGCLNELHKLGVAQKNISIIWAPGSFELPVLAQKLARKKAIDAVICLGAVIRGETYHFEVVAQGVAQGVMQASLNTGKPILLGVLTTDSVKQANSRSDVKRENKGREVARAAFQMVETLKNIN